MGCFPSSHSKKADKSTPEDDKDEHKSLIFDHLEQNSAKTSGGQRSLQSLLKSLPKYQVHRAINKSLVQIKGPNDNEDEESYKQMISARTISTYPRNHGRREGDPVCDAFRIEAFANLVLAVVCDGCGWGDRPRKAALTASEAFINFLYASSFILFRK